MDANASPQANPMLAQMKDIVLPPEVPAWPPAPWVWAVALLLVLILAMAIWFWRKRRAARQAWLQPRDEALSLLGSLSPATEQFALELSALLKRAALSYFPRAEVASLTGAAWTDFLNQRLPSNAQGNFSLLQRSAYQPAPMAKADAEALKALAEQWLIALPQTAKATINQTSRHMPIGQKASLSQSGGA